MRIKDRTAEFFAAVSLKSQQSSYSPYVSHPLYEQQQPLSPRSPRSAMKHHTRFTMAALEINTGIRSLLSKLEKLAKLANSKKIYDDRSAEVKELTFIIKKELTGLTQKIGTLKAIQSEREDGCTGATEDHQNGVVSMLQGQLANASSRFTQVLQISSSNMRAQRDRREQFGSMAVPVQQAANGPSQRSLTKQRSGIASREEQREQHVSIEMPFQKMAIAEQDSSAAYLDSRNTALQGIESTINELGTIYQQLAHLISQQGEAVQRIDMNIESMQINVQRGQAQLMKYLRSVSSNRWLMVKVFAVLILFSIIFTFFFT